MVTVKIADLLINLDFRYAINDKFVEDYLAQGEAAFTASCSDEDIQKELAISDIKIAEYSENACICRNVAEKIIDYDRFLFHSATIEVGGKAVAFAAKSGVGKSTHVALWLKNFDDCKVLNGDKPFFHFDGQEFTAYGSPWQGKEDAGYNGKAKLYAVCFLKRGEKNEMRKMTAEEAFTKMFLQVSFPKEIEHKLKLTELLNELSKRVDCYELSCNISDEAAIVARKELKL
ncbi:MAG: hypothetical protein ACI4MQ_04155 [Candidatus Coproplasma sp.]